MLEINGLKYSKVEFEDYKIRCKVKITTIEDGGKRNEHILDIFTTDENRESVENVLLDRKSDKVTSLTIFHWATKEEDDASAKLIDEIFKVENVWRKYDKDHLINMENGMIVAKGTDLNDIKHKDIKGFERLSPLF